jgi:hypothetical protein
MITLSGTLKACESCDQQEDRAFSAGHSQAENALARVAATPLKLTHEGSVTFGRVSFARRPLAQCSFRPPPGARYQPPLTRVADRPLTRLLPDCAGQERAFPLFDRSIASFARSERCFGRLRRRLPPGGSPSDPGGILAPAINRQSVRTAGAVSRAIFFAPSRLLWDRASAAAGTSMRSQPPSCRLSASSLLALWRPAPWPLSISC